MEGDALGVILSRVVNAPNKYHFCLQCGSIEGNSYCMARHTDQCWLSWESFLGLFVLSFLMRRCTVIGVSKCCSHAKGTSPFGVLMTRTHTTSHRERLMQLCRRCH